MSKQLLAGAAKIVITPPVGVDMCGYGARPGPSAGVHDDLRAAALYLDGTPLPGAASGEVIIITCDLIGLSGREVAEVRQLVTEATGVPGGQVMIACSHTHAGPATDCLTTLGKPDAAYLSVLRRKLAGLAKMAKDSAQPAALGTLREPVTVGINRRQMTERGMTMARNERGRTAPYVDVVAVDTAAGEPLARLFVHAAHAVTLGSDNQLLSADWPGYAQRYLERVYGPDCVTMFGQGCCGNINSDPVGSFAVAEAQGRAMAGAVIKAAEYATKEPEVVIGATSEELQLPCADPPAVADAEATLAQARQDAANPQLNYGMKLMYAALVEWAERILKLSQAGATGLTVPFEVQTLRLGDFALTGLPGEVFVEYALNLDQTAPYAETATVAYTNGNIGYVPTAEAFPEGGYEVDMAIKLYGDTMPTPACEALILAAGEQQLRALRPAGT
jgi:hypothetical protein